MRDRNKPTDPTKKPMFEGGPSEVEVSSLAKAKRRERSLRRTATKIVKTPIIHGYTVKYIQPE